MTYRQHIIEALRLSGIPAYWRAGIMECAEIAPSVLAECEGGIDAEFQPPGASLERAWETVKALPIVAAMKGEA